MEYSIMILDDEIRAINHFIKTIEDRVTNCRVVGAYTNPYDALNHEKNNVEIVFADIVMPGMNGLEFAAKLIERFPHAKIVLLTAYPDFDYAKEAVKIGVTDYWLKHEIRNDTIVQKMKSIFTVVDRERMLIAQENKRSISQVLDEKEPFLSLFPEAGEKHRFFLAYCMTDQPLSSINNQEPSLCTLSNLLFLPHCKASVFIGAFAECHNVMPDWFKTPNLAIILSESFECKNYSKNIHYQFCDILQNIVIDKGNVREVRGEEIKFLLPLLSICMHLEETYFSPCEKALSDENRLDFLEQLEPMWQKEYPVLINKQVAKFILERLTQLTFLFGVSPLDDYTLSTLEKLKNNPAECHVTESLNFFREYYQRFTEHYQETEHSTTLIHKVRQYIQANLGNNLGLDCISAHFMISGDHLRKVFKQETGETISEYVTATRIKRAKQMISTRKYKVYEVAQIVGYNSPQYFSQAFFNAVGIYPSDMR